VPSSFQNPRAVVSLIFARIVYALNWVNVGAIFYLIAPDLGAGISGLGAVTATFYLGLGILQIPGGLLAARWGPKRVVVIGIFLSSLAVLGTSVSADISQLAIFRFMVGWGMAFVFAPAVVMIAGLLRGGRSGMGVGLLNSAFNVGGLFGLFGWVVVATVTGWRLSLLVSGGLGILTGVLVAISVPGDSPGAVFKVDRRALIGVLGDKQLILLGLGTIGFAASYTVISGFMVTYGVNYLRLPGTSAGLVTSLITVVPIFTSLWGGRAFDLLPRHRVVAIASLLGGSAALAIGSYPSLYAATACSAIGGVLTGVGYTFAFAGARDLNRAGKEYESLAVAWVNSISLTGSFFPPVFFAYAVDNFGYQAAWLWSGGLSLVFLIPILLMVEEWRR
jgi:MFS family permease